MSLSREELLNWVDNHVVYGKGLDILKNDCDIIEFMLDNCEIEIPNHNRFFVKVDCKGVADLVKVKRIKPFHALPTAAGFQDGIDAFAYTGNCDYSHTIAEWESVISLGIYGLRKRIEKYARANTANERGRSFYEQEMRVFDAVLRFIKRASMKAASCGRSEMASSLLRLTENSPSNLFEALQTSIIYYFLQHFFDGTCLRTMGRIDKLFYPYYVKEDKEEAEKMLFDYVKEIDRLDAPSNIPFALGGTDLDGNDMINELSYAWIATYKKADTTNTKLHLLCSEHTPADIIKTAFQYIREGNNSIVFLSDKRVIEALEKQGIERKDAVGYHVVGCYECGGEGELTCSCNARVNVPKALELALNGGRDMLTGKFIGPENDGQFETFEALYKEFERQLTHLCQCAMQITNLYESHYSEIHSAPILSGTYTSALQKGGDLYLDYTARYNNSSLNAIGLATATDSLAAIRKAVFEDKTLTLGEFTEILRSDWRGQETFRLLIKIKYPKYGQGDSRTDELAKMTVDALSDAVSYKPNAKGGKWRLGLFSIDWRWDLGKKTAASADGRRSGETLSQNTSASFGADKEGATAHLISAARIDTVKTPNGAVVDIDLHSSAVRGENGITALVSSLKTYFELGGFAVQYNVLDTDVLLDAKKTPEKYPSLQVRLCGWNVLFSTLSEKEKDEFIARSMK
jgi:formate C-acetyltransferase